MQGCRPKQLLCTNDCSGVFSKVMQWSMCESSLWENSMWMIWYCRSVPSVLSISLKIKFNLPTMVSWFSVTRSLLVYLMSLRFLFNSLCLVYNLFSLTHWRYYLTSLLSMLIGRSLGLEQSSSQLPLPCHPSVFFLPWEVFSLFLT